jgi:hypothetical protein
MTPITDLTNTLKTHSQKRHHTLTFSRSSSMADLISVEMNDMEINQSSFLVKEEGMPSEVKTTFLLITILSSAVFLNYTIINDFSFIAPFILSSLLTAKVFLYKISRVNISLIGAMLTVSPINLFTIYHLDNHLYDPIRRSKHRSQSEHSRHGFNIFSRICRWHEYYLLHCYNRNLQKARLRILIHTM